jgi:hypothetical protein
MVTKIILNMNTHNFGLDRNTVEQLRQHAAHKEQALHNKAVQATNEATQFLATFQQASYASKFSEYLIQKINEFNSSLDAENEVGLNLVSFNQSITIHVSGVGYYDPNLVYFVGQTDTGNRIELVQHVSQISFVLVALPRLKPEEPKRPIGFIQNN